MVLICLKFQENTKSKCFAINHKVRFNLNKFQPGGERIGSPFPDILHAALLNIYFSGICEITEYIGWGVRGGHPDRP